MKTPAIWSYLIHLGSNMWNDKGQTEPSLGEPGVPAWHDTLQTDEKTWDEVVRFLPQQGINTVVIDLGEGVVYDSHPELAVEGSWTKEKLCRKLDEIRALGMEPVPKMNFSACHDAWLREYSHRLSTPEYLAVVKDLIDEACELFGKPRYFHLGMDEETAEHQRWFSYAVIRGETYWWKDFYCMLDCVEKNGARPWIWSDYYWNHPDVFVRKMPKEVLQSNWYYGNDFLPHENGQYNRYVQTYLDLDRLGYDQVPTSSTWSTKRNTYCTMIFGRKSLSEDHLAGFMTAPWLNTRPAMKHCLMGDAEVFGDARKLVYGS